MGVRGLETYLERYNRNACYKVDIRDIILSYRRETGRTPKIVIDGMSLLPHLYNKKLPWITGGQLKELLEVIKEFINAFVDLGAELLVIFDGPPVITKRDVKIKRRLEKLQDCYKLFDDLCAGKNPLQIQRERNSYVPSNVAGVLSYVFKLSNGCEVRKSILECDQEISKYALENECLAIFAQDTDFVIFEGAKFYWSMKNFDLESMTTLNYDRIELADSLFISPQHLPLMASLLGNDIVPYDLLLPFKKRLLGNSNPHYIDFKVCIKRVCNYIRNLPVGPALYDYLPQIAKEVFDDENKASMLLESLNSYNSHPQEPDDSNTGDDDWSRVLLLVKSDHISGKIPGSIYGIITNQRYTCSTGLEDFRKQDLPPSLQILRNLRQHIYGILFFEKPLPDNQSHHVIRELVVTGPRSLDSDAIVNAILPNVEHPGLAALWNKDDKSIDNIRWSLVGDAIQVSPALMRKLPQHLVVPSVAIRYLLKQGLVVSKWEIDAVVSSNILLRELSADYLKSLPLQIPDSRSLRLQTIFTRAYGLVILLFSVCGHPIPSTDLVAFNYQDGKLFLSKYLDAKNGFPISRLCDNKVTNIETYNSIMEFISYTG